MTYTIAEPCIDVKDRACVDECPVDCIYEGGRMLYIHPDECVDCGACEPVCPVTAIFYEDDVPGEWKQFTPINAEFFNDDISGIGSPPAAPHGSVRSTRTPSWRTSRPKSRPPPRRTRPPSSLDRVRSLRSR
jgi:NAD-dependent dihydropyrimidine dehydrogenase PreA subunit